jgi:hypothetical protein
MQIARRDFRFTCQTAEASSFRARSFASPRNAGVFVSVMAGLDPAIHLASKMLLRNLMDARIKSGHDE